MLATSPSYVSHHHIASCIVREAKRKLFSQTLQHPTPKCSHHIVMRLHAQNTSLLCAVMTVISQSDHSTLEKASYTHDTPPSPHKPKILHGALSSFVLFFVWLFLPSSLFHTELNTMVQYTVTSLFEKRSTTIQNFNAYVDIFMDINIDLLKNILSHRTVTNLKNST